MCNVAVTVSSLQQPSFTHLLHVLSLLLYSVHVELAHHALSLTSIKYILKGLQHPQKLAQCPLNHYHHA